jgi:GntR family transcriptional regulator of vanillate catabolism
MRPLASFFDRSATMTPSTQTLSPQRQRMLDDMRGEGTRAQNLAVEHTEVAQMNMRLALERRAESEQVLPGIRLVMG